MHRIVGTWESGGTRARGRWVARLPVRLTDTAGGVIHHSGLYRSGKLAKTGDYSLDFEVPASNDPDITPNGWQIEVEVRFATGNTETYVIPTADGDTTDLSDVILPQDVPDADPFWIRGEPGGLAELDADGDVVNADGDKVGIVGVLLRPIAGETWAACSARLQAALDNNQCVTLADGDFNIRNSLRLNSNNLLTLWNARLIRQDDGTTDPNNFDTQVIRNKNPNATGNTNIRIRGIGLAQIMCDPSIISLDKRRGDTPNGRPDLWYHIGVAFVNCTKVRVTDVQIGPVHTMAANTQLCTDVIWDRVELLQDGSIVNQDGIDVGPGCSDIHIINIKGTVFDDFCSIYAQRSSGSLEQGYVKPYLDGGAARANITDLFVKNVRVAPGVSMFRMQAGDGASLSRVYIDSIEVMGILCSTVLEMGPTAYLDSPSTFNDFSRIEARSISGRFKRVLGLDAPCKDIHISDVTMTSGSWAEVVGYSTSNAIIAQGITVDGVRAMPTTGTGGGQLVHLRPAGPTTDVSVKNVYLGFAGCILNDERGNTGIHISDVNVRVMAGVPFRTQAGTSGTVDRFSYDSQTSAMTALWAGTAAQLRMGPHMPPISSVDVPPAPLLGSFLFCDTSKNPVGDGVTGAGLYAGAPTGWTRLATLSGDTVAPTTPGTPVAVAGAGSTSLTWTASTDNVAVTGYRVFRSDAPSTIIGVASTNSYVDTAPPTGVTYTYTVRAIDAAGNVSPSSGTSNPATPTFVTFSADTFNRVNGAPGSTDTGGFAWTANPPADISKWQISSNRLVKLSGQGLSIPAKEILIDDAAADGIIQVTFVSTTPAQCGISFRVSADGTTGFIADRGADQIYRIRTRDNATYTTIYTSSAIGAAGDVVKLTLTGSSIKLTVNGNVLTTVTNITNQTATRHGLYASTASTTTFDDWSHISL